MNWTDKEIEIFKNRFANTSNKELAFIFKKSISAIKNKAQVLGLKKSKEYILSFDLGKKGCFKKGRTPFNKGKKLSDYLTAEQIDKFKKTQFKKNNKPHNYKIQGTIVVKKMFNHNYKLIKIDDNNKWQLLHRYNWEKINGKIPAGHNIIFKDKNTLNCEIENLELISKQENMLINSRQKYQKEHIKTLTILNKIKTKIKAYENKN